MTKIIKLVNHSLDNIITRCTLIEAVGVGQLAGIFVDAKINPVELAPPPPRCSQPRFIGNILQVCTFCYDYKSCARARFKVVAPYAMQRPQHSQ